MNTSNNPKETILAEFKRVLAEYRNPEDREANRRTGWDRVLHGQLNGLQFALEALGMTTDEVKQIIKTTKNK